MRYDAILLDMDGTVLNTIEDLTDAMNAALRHYDMPERSLEEVRAFVGNGARRLVEQAVPAGTPEALTEQVLDWYKPYYDAHCQIKTRPYDGIDTLLRDLREKGLRLCILSNKPDPAVKILAEKHFPGLLDLALGETAAIRRKPWPDMILACAETLRIEKERFLYVGDSEVDVLTARNAGIDCASVCWGFRTRQQLLEAGAARIFDRPESLRDWILKQE